MGGSFGVSLDRWLDGWIIWSINGQMGMLKWLKVWVSYRDVWIKRFIHGWIDVVMYGWMDGWMDGWVFKCINNWMDSQGVN